MKRVLSIAAIALAILVSLGAVAYAVTVGSGEPEMVGVIVAPDNISLRVPDQVGAAGSVTVAEVKVPGPSWIAVHLDDNGKPGMRVGLQHLNAGTSTNVKVALEGELTSEIIVALHADRGVADSFDFAMDSFMSSPDKPYWVNGKEMATRVRVR